MTSSARRRFLQTASSAAALATVPAAFAGAPMASGTAVSAHRMKLGAFEVTTILDGFIDLPPAVLQGDVEVGNGDIFVSLDLTAHILPHHHRQFQHFSQLHFKQFRWWLCWR